ncbi:MAG: hypothetical protein AAB655_02005 [Patescibacteria group bacterium]
MFWNRFLKHKSTAILFSLALAFVLGGVFWTFFGLKRISGPVVVHFNNLAGINQIGSLWELLSIGAIAAVIIFSNFIIAVELEERDRFLGKTITGATLLFGILIFIGFAAIISVN